MSGRTRDFRFLAQIDPKLVNLASKAIRDEFDDSDTSISRTGKIAEQLIKWIGNRAGIPKTEREISKYLNRLYSEISGPYALPIRIVKEFNKIAEVRNIVVHDIEGLEDDVKAPSRTLDRLERIVLWMENTYGAELDSDAGREKQRPGESISPANKSTQENSFKASKNSDPIPPLKNSRQSRRPRESSAPKSTSTGSHHSTQPPKSPQPPPEAIVLQFKPRAPPPPQPPPRQSSPPPVPPSAASSPSSKAGCVIGVGFLIGLIVFFMVVSAGFQAGKSHSSNLIQSAVVIDGAGREFSVFPASETPVLIGHNASADLALTYSGATVGKDKILITLTGPGSRGSCAPIVVDSSSGVARCGYVNLQSGPYTFNVSINGNMIGHYPISISDPARATGMISYAKIAPDVQGEFQSIRETQTIEGSPTPVGIALRFEQLTVGDYIDTELYMNGQYFDRCNRRKIDGWFYWCQFKSVNAGHGEFRVSIDGSPAGIYRFTVASAAAIPSNQDTVVSEAVRRSPPTYVSSQSSRTAPPPTSPSLPAVLSGEAQFISPGVLLVDGHRIELAGVRETPESRNVTSLNRLVASNSPVTCRPDGRQYRCSTPSGIDLGTVVIKNGLALDGGGYSEAEDFARRQKQGIWE